MIYGLYHSAAGMMINEYRQGVISNNLANAETVGFKRDVAVFAERLRASEEGLRGNASNELLEGLAGGSGLSGGVWLGQTETDFAEGARLKTDGPLDVALDGPGFLRVNVAGRELLTRDGRMVMDQHRRLVSALDGAEMVSSDGGPIVLDPKGGPASISEDGTIVQDGAEKGRLGLTDVSDYRALRKAGAGRFVAPEGARLEASPRVHAGYVESSGVRPVPTMVEMIEASRAYQINARMLTLQDDTLGRLIGQVPNL